MNYKKISFKCLSMVLVIVLISFSFFVNGSVVAFASARAAYDSDPVPINPNANTTCRNFYQYLWNVGKSDKVVSGVVSSKLLGYNTQKVDAENDYYEYVKQLFGVTPVINGNIFTVAQLNDELAETIAERYKKGAIPQFQLDPGGSLSKLEDRTDGIMNYDKTNPDRDMELYNGYLESRKKVGEFLKKLESMGVEVYIVRLFIENNNSSKHGFYGETTKGLDSFKRVWKDTVEYLIKDVNLTGILVAYAPAGFRTSKEYYPGEDCVDINGPTVYANSCDGEIVYKTDCADYEWMKNIKKPFAFTELAARSVLKANATAPIGDYKSTLESILYAYPEISFFSLWYENQYSLEPSNGSSSIGSYNGDYFIYHPSIISCSNIVDYRSKSQLSGIGYASFYSDDNKICNLELGKYTSSNIAKYGLRLSEVKSVDIMFGCAVIAYQGDNCTGKSQIIFDKTSDLATVFKTAKSIEVVSLENLALGKEVWSDNEDSNIFKVVDGKDNRFVTSTVNIDNTLDIDIDLGSKYVVGQLSINHASFFEDSVYNIRDFAVYASNDDESYTMIYKTVGNTYPASNVTFKPIEARYFKISVLVPNSSASAIEYNRVSLAEICIYGLENKNFSNLLSLKKYTPASLSDLDIDDSNNDGESDFGNDEVDNKSNSEKTAKKTPLLKNETDNSSLLLVLIIAGCALLVGAGVTVFLILRQKHKKRSS